MNVVNAWLDGVRELVRSFIRVIARGLNTMTGGAISPNFVTLTSLLAHAPIAWFIADQKYILAAILLIFFGLFDALDGELARLQKRASNAGMLLDASTDRMKEVILYSGAAFSFVSLGKPYMSVWAVVACGSSLLVSYVKAKGETAVKDARITPNEVNRLFQDGIMRFEVRMALLIAGLVINQLFAAVIVIAIGSWLTAVMRLIRIGKQLNGKS